MFGFINNLKVSVKLTGLAVILATLPAVIQAIVSYTTAESSMRQEAITRLEAIQAGRFSELNRWINGIEQDLLFQAENASIIDALYAFDAGYKEFGDDALFRLQQLYISENPNPTGEKEKLDFALDGSAYSEAHARYHPGLRAFLNARGYYDVFLFNTVGDLVYSVFKELDYATNVISGEWRNTDLANAFKAADQSRGPGSVHFFDFKPYAPSADAPASFISAPVFDNGRYIGVLVFQMPIGTLNAVMQQADGLGQTGETYAVGSDRLMRSDSRFSDGQDILSTRVEKESVTLALSGQSGVSVGENYRGQRVLSAAAPFTYRGATWAVVAEMGLDEVNAAATQLRNRSLILLVIIAGLFSASGWLLARTLAIPLGRMIQSMEDLASGNLDAPIPAENRADEIGMMAKALGVFRDSAKRAQDLEAQQAEAAARAAEEKKRAMAQLADEFEQSVGGIVSSVGQAAGQMEAAAQSLTALAGQTADSLTGAQRSAEEASMNTDTVASAAEELSASISEISRQVADSSALSDESVHKAEATNQMVDGLADASQKIGEVVALITEIAEQTNLLALNATIEAARAGEAGKGFAVVASEVKNLASQTAQATDDISKQIQAIQSATGSSVDAIREIGSNINSIADVSGSITAAVDQQNAATQEISQSVQSASRASAEVTQTIVGVARSAQETGQSANEVLAAAQQLSANAASLQTEVDNFLNEVRAG